MNEPPAKPDPRPGSKFRPTCNIDAKGKAARLTVGLVTLAGAAVVGVLTASGVLPGWGWFVAGGAALGGAFGVYEAWAGWCVVRAMGFKTPV